MQLVGKKEQNTDIPSASFVSINTDIQWLSRLGTAAVPGGDGHGSACCCGVGAPAAPQEGSQQPHWESSTPPACRAKITKPLHSLSFLGSKQQRYLLWHSSGLKLPGLLPGCAPRTRAVLCGSLSQLLSCPKIQVLSSLPALKKTAELLLLPTLCLCSQLEQISAPVGEAGVAPKGTPRLSSPPQGWISGGAGCAPSRGWAVALAPGSGAGFGFWGWIWVPGAATRIPALGAPPKAGVITPPARRGARGKVAGQILGVTIAPRLRANFTSPQRRKPSQRGCGHGQGVTLLHPPPRPSTELPGRARTPAPGAASLHVGGAEGSPNPLRSLG